MFGFNKPVDRLNTSSVKWDLNQEVLPLWVADMDLESPPAVIKALKKRINHKLFGYTLQSDEYNDAVVSWMQKRYDWMVRPDEIVFSSSVVSAIIVAINTLTSPGDGIIIQPPVYHSFKSLIINNGRSVVENNLILKNNKYEMDFDDLEKKASEGAKVIILCNPQNPSGKVWEYEDLKKVGDIALKYNMLVISDEIHADLILNDSKHIPFTKVSDEFKKNTIICNSPSKTFNLAGLHTSNMIIHDITLRDKIKKGLLAAGIYGPSPLGQAALIAAYTQGDAWLDKLLTFLKKNYTFLKESIENNIKGAKVLPLESTYLAWVDLRTVDFSSSKLRKRGKVWVEDGESFGTNGKGFIRINFATSPKILEEGLKRIYTTLWD